MALNRVYISHPFETLGLLSLFHRIHGYTLQSIMVRYFTYWLVQLLCIMLYLITKVGSISFMVAHFPIYIIYIEIESKF